MAKAKLHIHIWKVRFTGQVMPMWIATPNADMAEVREVLGRWEDHEQYRFLETFELVSSGTCLADTMLAAAQARLAEVAET